MIKNILVSLVSAQTIPNVLLIKTLPTQDSYCFVSTKKMEQERRTNWIIQTCNIPENKKIVKEVIEDNLSDITDKLSALDFSLNDNIIVNLTGGTKIMSLAAFNYFKSNFLNVTFYYKSITQYEYFDVEDAYKIIKITHQPSVEEYLNAYGIACTKKQHLHTSYYTESFFQSFLENRIDSTVIGALRKHYRGKKSVFLEEIINFTEETESDQGKRIENMDSFLSSINYPLTQKGKLTKKDIEYLTGGWFEEYVFHKLKHYHSDADVSMGVILVKGDQSNENDLDVVLCYRDQLFVIECKTSLALEEGKYTQLFNESVYKASAINKNFGLNARSFLFTLDDFQNKLNDFNQKAKKLSIDFNDISTIKDDTALKNMIKYAPQPI